MSLLVQVEEKLRREGVGDIPKTVREVIEFVEKHGIDAKIEVLVPRPRDPVLYVNGKPVIAWIKL